MGIDKPSTETTDSMSRMAENLVTDLPGGLGKALAASIAADMAT
jgi:hypothetical protein